MGTNKKRRFVCGVLTAQSIITVYENCGDFCRSMNYQQIINPQPSHNEPGNQGYKHGDVHKLENCILDYLVQSKVECSSFNVSNVLTTMGLFLNVEETKKCVDLCENSDVKIEIKKQDCDNVSFSVGNGMYEIDIFWNKSNADFLLLRGLKKIVEVSCVFNADICGEESGYYKNGKIWIRSGTELCKGEVNKIITHLLKYHNKQLDKISGDIVEFFNLILEEKDKSNAKRCSVM